MVRGIKSIILVTTICLSIICEESSLFGEFLNWENSPTEKGGSRDSDESEEEGRIILGVKILGNKRISDSDIKSIIRSRKGLRYFPLRVAEDIRSLYRTGMFDYIEVRKVRKKEGVILLYYVKERPIIRNVKFTGNKEVDDDKIKEVIDIKEGSFLDPIKIKSNLDKIKDLYAEKGYLLAEVNWELEKVTEDEVDIIFKINENYEVKIRDIVFIGNKHLPKETLISVLQNRPEDLLSFITDFGKFKEEYFERDKVAIKALYADYGYLDVQVGEPRISLSPDKRYIYITIPIEEGEKYRVGRVTLNEVLDGKVVEPLGGRAKVRSLIKVRRGEWFNRSKVAGDILSITKYYKDHGYAFANVIPQTEVDPKTKSVNLSYIIERGQLVYIERIEIKGNEKTRDKVIRREMRIAEGDRYSQSLIDASKRRIMMLGYFTEVEITEEQGSNTNYVVLKVKVKERPTGQIQVGGGFSSVETFIFTAQIAEYNFLGYGFNLSFLAQLSALRQVFNIDIVDPYFLDTNWIFSFDIYDMLRVYEDFNREAIGGSIGFGYPLLPDLRIYLSYRGEYVDVSTGGGRGLLFGGASSYKGGFTSLPLANLFDDGFSSSVRASISYDTRDNRLFPTSGNYNSIAVEIADPLLGSQQSFVRWTLNSRWYFPIVWGIVLKFNFDFGLIYNPYGLVPIYERYFSGGIFSVRGFKLRSLGPRISIPKVLDPNATPIIGGINIGGNYEVVFNIELEFPIIPQANIRGVLFFDAGNAFNLESVWCEAFKGTKVNKYSDPCNSYPWFLRTSIGFGFRWFSPMGPLRFEWGIPLDRQPGEEKIDFQFTIGNVF